MGTTRRSGFTPEMRAELWKRWKAGESLATIGEALGKRASSIYLTAAARGGIPPSPRRRAGRTLNLEQREVISRGIASGDSMRRIARSLGRSASTVSREIARHGGRERYRATQADAGAWRRAERPKGCRLAEWPRLRDVVADKLKHNWAPEQISRWLKSEFAHDATMQVSHETIYRSLFVQARGVLKKELISHLRRAGVIRHPRHKKMADNGIVEAISIRERPAEVADRAVPGHWEGDLISGSHESHSATLVERRTRFAMLVKIERKEAKYVAAELAKKMRKLPLELRRSLTWDRGTEMAAHKLFTVATDVQVYFCDPRSPWQRGSNENTNGLLRQYFPKGTDLSVHSQSWLDRVAAELNGRPRETLDWRSPAQTLANVLQ